MKKKDVKRESIGAGDISSGSRSGQSSMSQIGQMIRREPLVHFVLLAALLFLLDHLFASAQREKILVDRQTAEYLIKQREELELRELNAAEKQETIASYVEDEILYAEAYKRGLDRNDSRMRRNMILKMRGLLVGDVEAPTEEQLLTFFEEHRKRFISPATWSLEQVFYSDLMKVPEDLLDALRQGQDPTTFGEAGLMQSRSLLRKSQRFLIGTFGTATARAIIAIGDDQWYGPFESPRGVHFVRVLGREPAQKASYESVRPYLEGEWTLAQSRKIIEQEIGRIRDSYQVIIEDAGEASR
jgi:hypothetical protein